MSSTPVAYPSSGIPSSMSLLEPSWKRAGHFGIGGAVDSRQVIEECAIMRRSVMALNNRVHGPLDVENDRSTILPFVFLLGNHSSGKSSFINYLLHNSIQECGVAPTDDKFTVIVAGSSDLEKDGNSLIGDPEMGFTGLRKFGPALIHHTQLKVRSNIDISDIMFVDTPGMIDSPDILGGSINKAYDRGYNFEKVVKWYADRADVILLFFDPDKPGTTGETLSILTNALAGMDSKLHIILNKVDQFEKIHDFARVYGSLCWNLSKVIHRKDLPPIYPMYLPPRYRGDSALHKQSVGDAASSSSSRLSFASALDDVKDQIVKEIMSAPQKRIDNEIQRLSDSMTTLLMHCKIFNAMCNRYRDMARSFNGECFMSLLLCCGITSGTVAFELPREATLAAGVASAATLGCIQYYRWRGLIRGRNAIIQDRAVANQVFQSVYAHELVVGDESVEAMWPKVYDHISIRVSPEELGSAALVTDAELGSISAILNTNVNRMRSLLSPQLKISKEELDIEKYVA